MKTTATAATLSTSTTKAGDVAVNIHTTGIDAARGAIKLVRAWAKANACGSKTVYFTVGGSHWDRQARIYNARVVVRPLPAVQP